MQAVNQLIGAITTSYSWLGVSSHPVIFIARPQTYPQITYNYVIKHDGWSIDIGGGKFVQQQHVMLETRNIPLSKTRFEVL